MDEENKIAPINEVSNEPIYEIEEIKQKIYTIRGKQVMLDSDVAALYNYKTKALNLAVKRNIERFPKEFCFQLTEKEYETLRFHFETSKNRSKIENRGGRRYFPYVFTEQGVAMLAGILKNETAIHISIEIIKAFIEMRNFIANNYLILENVHSLELRQMKFENFTNEKFDKVFKLLGQEDIKQKIFFQGQIWDSYSLIVDIIKKAKEKIVIIDNYVDDSILKMLAKKDKDVEVVILTSDKSKISNLDVQKFNKEYSTLKLAKTNKFHDRFIVIDNKELYHCGASIKDLGKKCFAINKIEDIEIIQQIIKQS